MSPCSTALDNDIGGELIEFPLPKYHLKTTQWRPWFTMCSLLRGPSHSPPRRAPGSSSGGCWKMTCPARHPIHLGIYSDCWLNVKGVWFQSTELRVEMLESCLCLSPASWIWATSIKSFDIQFVILLWSFKTVCEKEMTSLIEWFMSGFNCHLKKIYSRATCIPLLGFSR